MEKKKDNLKKQQLIANQNERNKTNLESKYGSESMTLIDEENKISKDNLMLKKLKEDFNNIEAQIRQVLKQKRDKEEKVKKEEECKKVTEDTRAGLDKNYNYLKAIEKNIIKRTDQARERIEEIKAKKENNNINSLNSLSKKMNIFIKNYNKNILNNKSFLNKKNILSINMNIHKNINKELFTKSIKTNNKQINCISYKNNRYNSYKEQYILNMVKSYKKFSYTSQEKNNKRNNELIKKNKYYNNQKKIHENKISKMKNNNRCKKDKRI